MDTTEIVKSSRASIDKGDLTVLLALLSQLQPKVIVEIGTWKGYSADVWLQAFQPEKFVTLEVDQSLVRGATRGFWWGDSHLPETKQKVEEYLGGAAVDFLFIDGDHSLEGVTKDWEMYSPLVRKGGVVAFHDCLYYAKNTEEVIILWQELKRKYEAREIKTSLDSTGIGLLYL